MAAVPEPKMWPSATAVVTFRVFRAISTGTRFSSTKFLCHAYTQTKISRRSQKSCYRLDVCVPQPQIHTLKQSLMVFGVALGTPFQHAYVLILNKEHFKTKNPKWSMIPFIQHSEMTKYHDRGQISGCQGL